MFGGPVPLALVKVSAIRIAVEERHELLAQPVPALPDVGGAHLGFRTNLVVARVRQQESLQEILFALCQRGGELVHQAFHLEGGRGNTLQTQMAANALATHASAFMADVLEDLIAGQSDEEHAEAAVPCRVEFGEQPAESRTKLNQTRAAISSVSCWCWPRRRSM